MWKLEPRSAAGGQQYVYAGSELLVSRTPGAWLVISGDASVSRRHACLQLEHSVNDAKRGKASTLVLTDQNAKNGTYVRQSSANRQRDGNAAVLNESHRIEPGSRVQLQHGDVIRFGLSASYRVVCSPLVVATSMLPNNEAVLQHLHLLGAAFSRDWTTRCTHLVMETIKLSAKVACALACGGLIVTPAFLPALLQAVKEKNPLLPPAPDFLPAITEPSIQPSPSLFTPNCRRKMLFEGKNFCFGTEKGHRRLATIIRLAGGECAVLEARHEDLLCSGAALLLRTVEDTSSPTPTFSAALKALKKAGLHVIPESDIVLAVLYCSTERFCNPSVSQQLVLDRPAPHTQTQSSVAVLAAETQDVASTASTSKHPNSGAASPASRGRANVIPETPSSSCSSKKSALVGDALPTPINKPVDNDKAPSGTQLSNEDRNSNLPDVEGPTSSLNVPSVSVPESTSANANNGYKTSKKRYRSGENIVDNSAAKRSAPSKPALLDTQDIEMSQDDGDVKGDCSLNMSTFAPPLASTQIYEIEHQSNGFAKPAAGDNPGVRVSPPQKANTRMPKAVPAAQKSAVKTGVTCVPPTPTPPSQASLAELPAGRDASSPIPRNSVSPQSIVTPGQPETKTVAEISPILETLQSFPTETLGRTTQFCPELQTAPLPSLEPPCLDGILNSKASAPDAGPLVTPTSRDPFTLLNPNLSEKKGPSKTTDGFQLPAAGVRRRKVQAQQPSECTTSSAVNAVVGGIKRSRSTVELEEEKKRQRLASGDEDTPAPAPAVSVKQERCTPSPGVPAQSDLAADIPASYDGFVSGKRRQHKSPNRTTDVCDGKAASQVADPELQNGEVDKTEVKPPVAELEKNISVCRTVMVSLVLRTSIIGDDYQPPQESSSAGGTMNFKRFRKVRHGGAAASLPRIIGGRDLVPHTTIESDAPDRSIASTSANPRSLWLSQHPEVTRQIEQEDREREEDASEHQIDSIPNGTINSHSVGRNGSTSKVGSVASYFAGAGTSRSTSVGATQSGSVHSRAAFVRDDFSQYQMPSATVRKRVPRKRT